jgi:hypothetical protein
LRKLETLDLRVSVGPLDPNRDCSSSSCLSILREKTIKTLSSSTKCQQKHWSKFLHFLNGVFFAFFLFSTHVQLRLGCRVEMHRLLLLTKSTQVCFELTFFFLTFLKFCSPLTDITTRLRVF